jgi:transposase
MLRRKAEDSMQYSNDLRRKLVEAWLTGESTQVELADLFHVSLGWVEKVLRRWRTTGDTGAAPFHQGRYPVLSPDRVRGCVARHADATYKRRSKGEPLGDQEWKKKPENREPVQPTMSRLAQRLQRSQAQQNKAR